MAEDKIGGRKRELLFRGKSVTTGEWVFGSYCRAERLDRQGEEHLIIEYLANGQSLKVDPATVGQYTGLTDKTGKRIFEGDVVRGKGKRTFHVEYSADIASFIARANDDELTTPCMNYGTMRNYEVIGNRYEQEAQQCTTKIPN